MCGWFLADAAWIDAFSQLWERHGWAAIFYLTAFVLVVRLLYFLAPFGKDYLAARVQMAQKQIELIDSLRVTSERWAQSQADTAAILKNLDHGQADMHKNVTRLRQQLGECINGLCAFVSEEHRKRIRQYAEAISRELPRDT